MTLISNTIEERKINLYKVNEAWVVCQPVELGNYPIGVFWKEEHADAAIAQYWENRGALRTAYVMLFGKELSPAQKFKVSCEGLSQLAEVLDEQSDS